MKHWLVYILKSKNEDIKYDYTQVATLIKLRNKMAQFQRRFEENPTYQNIPQCITDKRECKKCPIYLPCATIAASLEENKNRRFPGTLEEYKHSTESLTIKQKDYLSKWIKLIGWKQCMTTLPTKRYSASKFNFRWKEDQPFTQQSQVSPKLEQFSKGTSSSKHKACYIQITFQKICKGLPVPTPIHQDDEVLLQGNSVPTTSLRGGVVVNKFNGNEQIVITIDRDEIKRAKKVLSQGEGQFITDVYLNIYQWSITSKGSTNSQGFDSSSSNREFSNLRGNIISMLSLSKDNPVLQGVIDGVNAPCEPTAKEDIENSIYLNFFQEYHEILCPAQKQLVNWIQEGQPIILLDSATGCGQSVALAFLIKLLHSIKMSVLLTGTSIVQIDHVLETMLQNLQDDWKVSFVRIGSKKIISKSLERYALPDQFDKMSEIEGFLKDKFIFAANIKDCGHLIFEAAQCKEFDYVIVIGSHLLSEPKSLAPISRAKHLILAGNSSALEFKKKQLTYNAREYEQSLFQRLLEAEIGSQMAIPLYSSFQLNKELLNFFNLAFFKMKLYHRDVPNDVIKSFFQPIPIGIDSFELEERKESAASKIKLTFTQRLFAQNSPAVCMVNVQPELLDPSNIYQANQTQQFAEAKVIDQILHEIKNFDHVNLSSKLHIFSPVKSHLKMLRLKIKKGTQVSISFVDDYPLTKAKDCVILSTGITCPTTDTAFPVSTLSAMMRGKSKLILVTNRSALTKVKGFSKVVKFFNERASSHIFDYKL